MNFLIARAAADVPVVIRVGIQRAPFSVQAIPMGTAILECRLGRRLCRARAFCCGTFRFPRLFSLWPMRYQVCVLVVGMRGRRTVAERSGCGSKLVRHAVIRSRTVGGWAVPEGFSLFHGVVVGGKRHTSGGLDMEVRIEVFSFRGGPILAGVGRLILEHLDEEIEAGC